jgi:hypothetical protein
MSGKLALTRASLHHEIIRGFFDHGHAPSCTELSAAFGVDAVAMSTALHDLADDHGVVLHPHAPEVWVAHPFSAAPTPFTVRHGERCWWSTCAWCSLGIAALLGGNDVIVDTTLGAEGRAVRIRVDDHRVSEELLVHYPIPMMRCWDNVVFTCSTMLVFDDEASIDAWCKRHALPRGDARPIQKAYDFARAWYGRHLDADWRKWTTEEARAMFQRFDLRGPIWDLPITNERF